MRFFNGLYQGDPVAWICLGIGVVVAIGLPAIRTYLASRNRG